MLHRGARREAEVPYPLAIESPASCMSDGVIFLLYVAYYFILLHFTHPPIIHFPTQLWTRGPCWLGTLGAERMWREHREDVEGTQRRAGQMLPPRRVAISTGSPAEILAADAAFWDAAIQALPAHAEPPVLPWPHSPSGALSSHLLLPRALPGNVPGCILLLPALLVCSLLPAQQSRSLQQHTVVRAGQQREQL